MTAVVLAALALGIGALLLGRLRTLSAAVDHRPGPAISIVVPARDEERSIRALLASVARLEPSAAEVIVVDDGSSDATGDVARAGGATVLRAPEPPPGWLGKSWACWQGAQLAGGELLVFLDADVTLRPDALARLTATYDRGLLSVQPYHRAVRAYESLSAPFNLVSSMGSGSFARWASRHASSAFGPCLVTSRADYEAVGGHAAVAGEIVEDIALAQRYRSAGLPVECRAGGCTVSFRMYPSGLVQLVEGWTKNLAAGARTARRGPVLFAVVAVVAALALALGTATRLATPEGELLLWSLSYLAVALGVRTALVRLGRFRWWAWALYPVPLVVFVAVFARSMWRTYVRRSVTWRGRTVPISATPDPVLVSKARPMGRALLTSSQEEGEKRR